MRLKIAIKSDSAIGNEMKSIKMLSTLALTSVFIRIQFSEINVNKWLEQTLTPSRLINIKSLKSNCAGDFSVNKKYKIPNWIRKFSSSDCPLLILTITLKHNECYTNRTHDQRFIFFKATNVFTCIIYNLSKENK